MRFWETKVLLNTGFPVVDFVGTLLDVVTESSSISHAAVGGKWACIEI